jgi:hypothetical protein
MSDASRREEGQTTEVEAPKSTPPEVAAGAALAASDWAADASSALSSQPATAVAARLAGGNNGQIVWFDTSEGTTRKTDDVSAPGSARLADQDDGGNTSGANTNMSSGTMLLLPSSPQGVRRAASAGLAVTFAGGLLWLLREYRSAAAAGVGGYSMGKQSEAASAAVGAGATMYVAAVILRMEPYVWVLVALAALAAAGFYITLGMTALG